MSTKHLPTHGGKRIGAGRKPAPLPLSTKAFRASPDEWKEFLSLLTGDARQDFLDVLDALAETRFWICPKCGFINYRNWKTCSKCNTPKKGKQS